MTQFRAALLTSGLVLALCGGAVQAQPTGKPLLTLQMPALPDPVHVTLKPATTALLVTTSAWARRESRGAHCRSDHPTEQSDLAHRTMTTLQAAREIAASLAGRPATRSTHPIIA